MNLPLLLVDVEFAHLASPKLKPKTTFVEDKCRVFVEVAASSVELCFAALTRLLVALAHTLDVLLGLLAVLPHHLDRLLTLSTSS